MDSFMDSLRSLILFFIKLAFTIFFIAFVWWLVSLIFPALSIKQMKQLMSPVGSNGKQADFLPSPRAYKGLVQAPTPTATSNLYVSDNEFKGYGNQNQVSYGGSQNVYGGVNYQQSSNVIRYSYSDGKGGVINSNVAGTQANPSAPYEQAQSDTPKIIEGDNRRLYIRNLSIYEGGHVYTGLSFVGEARNEMFLRGVFPIVITDRNGQVLGVSRASSTGAWSVAGWSRFEAKILNTLPNNVPCLMFFEQMKEKLPYRYSNEPVSQPLRIVVPIQCN